MINRLTNISSVVMVLVLSACNDSSTEESNTSSVNLETGSGYSIGGRVTGLSGVLELQNNGSDNLTLTQSGHFIFSNEQLTGASYNVSIISAPLDQSCTLSNESGAVAGSNINSVLIDCVGSSMLSDLNVSTGILSPAFDPDVSHYSVSVNNDISSIAVTAVAEGANAVMTVNGNSVVSGHASQTIALNEGSNTITVAVNTDANSSNTSYSITVYRALQAGLNFNAAKNKLAMTYEHALAIKPDGSLYVWGDNSQEQLGVAEINLFDQTDRLIPTLNALQDVRYVAAGSFHSLAITGDNGQVRAWGTNGTHELGIDDFPQLKDIGWPVEVKTAGGLNNLQGATAVACGLNYSVALMNDGRVQTWGFNLQGQLGLGHDKNSDFVDPVTSETIVVNNEFPNEVPGLVNIIAIAAGEAHTLALDNNGVVWSWGDNYYGQLGNAENGYGKEQHEPVAVGLTDVVAIAAGLNHSLALKSDGTVWAWGDNSARQLGEGTNVNSNVPVQAVGMTDVAVISAGSNFSFVIKNDGTLWELGNSNFENALVPNIHDDIIAIAVGNLAYIAMKANGELLSWGGLNASGQLGNNSTTSAWNFEGVEGFGPVNVLDSSATGVFDMLD